MLTPFFPSAVKIITDRETGRPRGFGFVTLRSAGDVDSALDYKEDMVIGCCFMTIIFNQEVIYCQGFYQ